MDGVLQHDLVVSEAHSLELLELIARELRRLRELLGCVAAADGRRDPAGSPALSLTRDGDVWAVASGVCTFRLRDSLGLRYLARLLAEPGRELLALDLASAGGVVDGGDAGEILDAASRGCYRRRLVELDEELAEAERFGDSLRVSRARGEREQLADEVARAVGLGGRERRCAAAAERARVAVTRRIRDAIRRIAAVAPALGRHLERAIRTGRCCSYQPA